MKNQTPSRQFNVKHTFWSNDEDVTLLESVRRYGAYNWNQIAPNLPGRTAKQCRERYHNHLNLNVNKGKWSEEEDSALLRGHGNFGNQWSKIAKLLDGRSGNDTKNRYFVLQRAEKRTKSARDIMIPNGFSLNKPVDMSYGFFSASKSLFSNEYSSFLTPSSSRNSSQNNFSTESRPSSYCGSDFKWT